MGKDYIFTAGTRGDGNKGVKGGDWGSDWKNWFVGEDDEEPVGRDRWLANGTTANALVGDEGGSGVKYWSPPVDNASATDKETGN